MTFKIRAIAGTLAALLAAALAWRATPALAIGDYAGEFPLLAALVGVFAALTIAGWIEDRAR